ncbi:MAG: hypothetical protein LBI75_07405 [Brucellaceae bacterium]|jgi:outer membrane lipoprotein-sorting protein|nr:hypothetical protein [Brucellaceae bacterium]
MKRFILAIAALGMIAPVAAQAAPVAHQSAAVQSHKPAVQKVAAHKTVKAKSTGMHKSSKHTVKKAAPKHAKK